MRQELIKDLKNKLEEALQIKVYYDDDYINQNIKDEIYIILIKNNEQIEELTTNRCSYKKTLDLDLVLHSIYKINTETENKTYLKEVQLENMLLFNFNQNQKNYKIKLNSINFDFENNNSNIVLHKTLFNLNLTYNVYNN